MHEPRPERTTSPTMITVLGMISVALIILGPSGVYAGMVLALVVLATVLASPVHRHDPQMLGVAAISTTAMLAITVLVTVSLR